MKSLRNSRDWSFPQSWSSINCYKMWNKCLNIYTKLSNVPLRVCCDAASVVMESRATFGLGLFPQSFGKQLLIKREITNRFSLCAVVREKSAQNEKRLSVSLKRELMTPQSDLLSAHTILRHVVSRFHSQKNQNGDTSSSHRTLWSGLCSVLHLPD